MKITRTIVVFDTADLAAESTFWAGLLGGTVIAEDGWHTVLVDGEARLGFQLAPDHQPPDWPDGQPQQIHLDQAVLHAHSGAFELAYLELGVRRHVLHHQHADRGRAVARTGPGVACAHGQADGVRLIASQ